MVGGLTREGDSRGLAYAVNPEDYSDNSSVSAAALEESEREREVEEGVEWESVASDQEDESEFEDPDEFGEPLVDEGGQEETREAGVEKVSSYLENYNQQTQ